jgi:hypothetical protein
VSEPILFADDTSVIISSRNFEDFYSISNLVLPHSIKCFAANYLFPNLDKMYKIKFITKNLAHSAVHIGYEEKQTQETVNAKFLGLRIDNHVNFRK